MSQAIPKNKIVKIQTLISRQDLRDEKEALVRRFSSAGSSSVKDLTNFEADQLLAALEGNTMPGDHAEDRMRKKILYYGYMMGWDQPRSESQKRMPSSQVNYINVNAFCTSTKSKVRKPLNEMDRQQLVTMLNQIEQVYKSTLKTI